MKIKRSVVGYLHALRRSGEINMFDAAHYLERDLDIPKKEAREVTMAFVNGDFEIEE